MTICAKNGLACLKFEEWPTLSLSSGFILRFSKAIIMLFATTTLSARTVQGNPAIYQFVHKTPTVFRILSYFDCCVSCETCNHDKRVAELKTIMFDFVKPDRIGLSSVPPQKSKPTTVGSQSKKPQEKDYPKKYECFVGCFH